jgi:hypothetical protein
MLRAPVRAHMPNCARSRTSSSTCSRLLWRTAKYAEGLQEAGAASPAALADAAAASDAAKGGGAASGAGPSDEEGESGVTFAPGAAAPHLAATKAPHAGPRKPRLALSAADASVVLMEGAVPQTAHAGRRMGSCEGSRGVRRDERRSGAVGGARTRSKDARFEGSFYLFIL